jgi:hypothetical protein
MKAHEYVLSTRETVDLRQRPVLDQDVEASLAWLADFTDDELESLNVVMLDILRTPQRPGADLSVPAYWVGAISYVRGRR